MTAKKHVPPNLIWSTIYFQTDQTNIRSHTQHSIFSWWMYESTNKKNTCSLLLESMYSKEGKWATRESFTYMQWLQMFASEFIGSRICSKYFKYMYQFWPLFTCREWNHILSKYKNIVETWICNIKFSRCLWYQSIYNNRIKWLWKSIQKKTKEMKGRKGFWKVAFFLCSYNCYDCNFSSSCSTILRILKD